jgi:hypothetical protein
MVDLNIYSLMLLGIVAAIAVPWTVAIVMSWKEIRQMAEGLQKGSQNDQRQTTTGLDKRLYPYLP